MPLGLTMAVVAAVGEDGALQDAWLKGPLTRLHVKPAPAGVQVAVSEESCAVVGVVSPLMEHASFAHVSVKLPPDPVIWKPAQFGSLYVRVAADADADASD